VSTSATVKRERAAQRRAVLEALEQGPGMMHELADRTGLELAAVRPHIMRLVATEIVMSRDGVYELWSDVIARLREKEGVGRLRWGDTSTGRGGGRLVA
jgi:predicted transcriptional regulator